MAEKSERGVSFPSFEFGITPADIDAALEESQQALVHPVIQCNASSVADTQRHVRALSQPVDAVMQTLRTVYDTAITLQNSETDPLIVAQKVVAQFPDILDYYGVLRRYDWGYSLGQKIIAVIMKKDLERT